MTLDNKKIVKNYINQVVNTGNTGLVPNFISPYYVETLNHVTYKMGIEGAVNHIEGVRKTYPDLKLTVELQIAEGEYVATCYTMRGHHFGEWMGIKPTGKHVAICGVNIDRVVDGKIVEHSGAANLLHTFVDIGAIKFKDHE